jgi:TfoX/Sxy family transcriptional regulator of competence genes
LDDLQTAILENQKLNSEKLIDVENMTTIKVENQNLSQKLENLKKRFSKFVCESVQMTSKQDEFLLLLEESDDKLMKQAQELERESEKSRLLKEENDALMNLSLGTR